MASWFYRQGDRRIGPISQELLQGMLQSGGLHPRDRVCREGTSEWVEAAGVPGLISKDATITQNSASTGRNAERIAEDTRVIWILAETGPWVRLMSIVTFCVAGFGALMGIEKIITGDASGILDALVSMLYLAPAIYLWQYAVSIKHLTFARQLPYLEAALQAQKSFWKFVGILTTVGLCILILVLALRLFF